MCSCMCLPCLVVHFNHATGEEMSSFIESRRYKQSLVRALLTAVPYTHTCYDITSPGWSLQGDWSSFIDRTKLP